VLCIVCLVRFFFPWSQNALLASCVSENLQTCAQLFKRLVAFSQNRSHLLRLMSNSSLLWWFIDNALSFDHFVRTLRASLGDDCVLAALQVSSWFQMLELLGY